MKSRLHLKDAMQIIVSIFRACSTERLMPLHSISEAKDENSYVVNTSRYSAVHQLDSGKTIQLCSVTRILSNYDTNPISGVCVTEQSHPFLRSFLIRVESSEGMIQLLGRFLDVLKKNCGEDHPLYIKYKSRCDDYERTLTTKEAKTTSEFNWSNHSGPAQIDFGGLKNPSGKVRFWGDPNPENALSRNEVRLHTYRRI